MKVSVLVPVYNGERHLVECLESILEQDFQDYEFLISDDGSTDGSAAIIQDFAARDKRIRWWKNSQKQGLIGNHNVCLREARGEFIKFVHQDDKLLSPTAISKLVAALEANPSATLAGCTQHLTDAPGKRATIFPGKSGVYDGKQVILAGLEKHMNFVGQPTLTLFRRSACERGFDLRFSGHLDVEMWWHLLEQGDFAYVAEPLGTWRTHETQQTARHRRLGDARHEKLLLMEVYFAKPWLQQMATHQMLFTQIYYLRKQNGAHADKLTAEMMSRLKPHRYAWYWLKHKLSHPFRKVFDGR